MTRLETAVPSDESPVECPHCGRPFESERLLTLHLGLKHYENLDDETEAAFVETYEAENDDLRVFRLKAAGLLVLLYFGFLFTYSIIP